MTWTAQQTSAVAISILKLVSPTAASDVCGLYQCFVTLPNGGARIELIAMPAVADAPAVNHVGREHIALSLEDKARVDRLAARYREGSLLLFEPRMTGNGFYEAVIFMPHGTPIEITSGVSMTEFVG